MRHRESKTSDSEWAATAHVRKWLRKYCWTWDQIFAEDKTSEKKSIMQLQCKGFPIANQIPGVNAQLELAVHPLHITGKLPAL